MDIFQLLDEDQRYQLFILRFQDLEVDDYVTIQELVELTGHSKFKITKFIEVLNYDLRKYGQSCKIVIQDDLRGHASNRKISILCKQIFC